MSAPAFSASPSPSPPPRGEGARAGAAGRALVRAAPLFVLGALALWFLPRGLTPTLGTTRGLSEAIPLVVAPVAAGRLVSLTVTVGQAVKAGEVVARLDDRLAVLERQRAEAERAYIEAKLEAETSREDDAVMRAEVWRLRTVAEAQHDRAELTALDVELARLDGLLGERLVRASDVEPRRRQREALAARIGTFDRARAAGQAGLDDKRGGGARAKPDEGKDGHRALVELRMAPLREALRVKAAEMQQIALEIEALTLRAPADGVVSAINRHAGEAVAAGEAALVIVAHRPGFFDVYLPERQTRLPAPGDAVTISRPGLFARGGRGRVVVVAPDVAELPARLRSAAQVPLWGRRVLVDASESAELLAVPAGEEIRARF